MVFRAEFNYLLLVVFVFLLTIRTAIQKISPHSGHQTIIRNPVGILASSFCKTIPGLSKYQIELCKQQPDTTMVALEGLNQAVKECQSQFDGHKWNCSSLSTKGKNPYVSAILQRGYKEAAFSYAIASAGAVIAVARACSSSSLQNCGCDEKVYKVKPPLYHKEKSYYGFTNGKHHQPFPISDEYAKVSYSSPFQHSANGYPKEGKLTSKESVDDQGIPWKWGGCSHNLKYGIRFSKLFLDSREKADDIRSKTNLHNNHVGRMVVKHNMRVRCKCHGVSGSCQIKTCWRSTPDLKTVGHVLKDKFKSAILVDQSNFGSKNLRKFNMANPKMETKKHLARSDKPRLSRKNKKKRDLSFDLLYYEKSPNFCDTNSSLDVPGTTGRLCNSTIGARQGSCSSLCCGRGYNSVKQTKLELCRCKFIWCCEVKCDNCNVTSWISVCK